MVLSDPFFLIGVILFLGFISSKIFEKTGISEAFVLILFGIVIGPVLGIVDVGEESAIRKVAPFMSTLALIFLIFDGGLNLKISKLIKQFSKSFLFSLISFSGTAVASGYLIHSLFSLELPISILLGIVLGGGSSAIVYPIIEKKGISGNFKTRMKIDSALSDVFVIVFALVSFSSLGGEPLSSSAQLAFQEIATTLSTSTVLGVLSALIWARIIQKDGAGEFKNVITLAMAFILYSMSPIFGANGAFSILVFAVVLGNASKAEGIFSSEVVKKAGKNIRSFQDEISFFVRTFFFAYIGLITFNGSAGAIPIAISIIVVVAGFVIRYVVSRIIFGKEENSLFVASLAPRGVAAIVVLYLVSQTVPIPAYFSETVAITILISNAIATAGIYFWGPGREKNS